MEEFECGKIYPLTIIRDRYNGVYSGGVYTAWNKYWSDIPDSVAGDDISCCEFWSRTKTIVGLGLTPNLAEYDLMQKLKESEEQCN